MKISDEGKKPKQPPKQLPSSVIPSSSEKLHLERSLFLSPLTFIVFCVAWVHCRLLEKEKIELACYFLVIIISM